ncbi:MAG: 23S rRNA (pseudouridine(1915)-N(3))-methyltransferase RlmH [Bacillota bacterium]
MLETATPAARSYNQHSGVLTIDIRVIAVGKIKENFYRQALQHYARRLKPYARLEIVELAEGKEEGRGDFALTTLLKEEGDKIVRQLRQDAHCIVLTPEGRKMKTEELAAYLKNLQHSSPRIDLVIGGAAGLAGEIKLKSDLCLSLSDLTFPHRLARVILLEQLYRCFKIIRGEPYHK